MKQLANFTTIEQENQEARQEMNNMYLKLIGDAERLKVLKFLYSHIWLFRIGSVLASMFGFFYDLKTGLGIIGAIAIALLIAYIIEAIKTYGTKASFAYKGWVRFGAIILTASVMYSAYLFHYKSLNNYRKMMNKEDSSYVYENKLKQDNVFNTINLALVKVLDNGTGSDDEEASSSIKSTNKAFENNGNDYATKAYLEASKITNAGLAATLFFIFVFLESCSLFGVIGGMVLMYSTDKNVKSIANTQDKLNQLEMNVLKLIETFLMKKSTTKIEKTMEELEKELEKESNSPTPQKTQDKNNTTQPTLNQLPYSSNYLQEIYGNPSVKNHLLNTMKPPRNNWFNDKESNISSMSSSSELTVYNKEENQEKSRRLTDGISKIIKIIDFENDTWLYYDKWLIMEDNNCTQSESCRVGEQVKDGFTMEELENKTTDRFIFSSVVKTEKQKLIWMEFVHAANKQYHLKNDEQNQEEGVIEAETVEEIKKETTVKAFNEKVPAIDLKVYSPDEQKFLIELFDNGNVRFRESLIGRRFVLKADAIKKIKNKAGKLGEFYIKLCETGIIEKVYLHPNNPVHKYIALAELHREKWQEK